MQRCWTTKLYIQAERRGESRSQTMLTSSSSMKGFDATTPACLTFCFCTSRSLSRWQARWTRTSWLTSSASVTWLAPWSIACSWLFIAHGSCLHLLVDLVPFESTRSRKDQLAMPTTAQRRLQLWNLIGTVPKLKWPTTRRDNTNRHPPCFPFQLYSDQRHGKQRRMPVPQRVLHLKHWLGGN